MQDADPRPLGLTAGADDPERVPAPRREAGARSAPLLAAGVGFSAQASQVLVLREVLGQVDGNEVVVGATLCAWLLAGALGAVAASPPARRALRPVRGLSLVLPLAAAATLACLVGVRMARGSLLMLAPGEAPTLLQGFAVAGAGGALAAFGYGCAFPFAARALGGRSAYAFEAAGAVVGGLAFTFLAAPLPPLGVAAALVAIAAALGLRGAPAVAVPLLLAGLAAAAFGDGLERRSRKAAYAAYLPGYRLLHSAQSRRGALDVLERAGQVSLYRNGHLDFSSPDEEGAAVRAHAALTLHLSPRRVLLVGGGPAVVREALLEPVEALLYVEADPEALDAVRPFLAPGEREALADPRVRVLGEDARAAIRGFEADLDVVALFGVEPLTAASNRFFTEEFYRDASAALSGGGLLVESLPGVENTLPPDVVHRNALVRAAARASFEHVLSTPGEAGFLVATSGPAPTLDPATLAARFRSRAPATRGFTEHHFEMLWPPEATRSTEAALADAEARLAGERNADLFPSAHLRTFLLRAKETGDDLAILVSRPVRWGLAAAALLAALALSARGSRPVASLATTGFCGMAAAVVILSGYQSARGDLYGEIGALSGTLMAGVLLGSLVRLPLLAADLGLAATVAAVPLAGAIPAAWFAASAAVGFLSGASYPAALARDGRPERLYGVDLAGAALGALVVGALFVPADGVVATCAGLAAVKLVPAAFQVLVRRGR